MAGSALPASAHNAVVSTTPEEGETLTEVPEFFVVTTNEAMLDVGGEGAGFAIQVTDGSGLFYGDGCVDVGGPSMSTPAALGEAGDYTMAFQYVSADGHTLSDTLEFRYEPAAGAEASAGSPVPPTCGEEPAAASGG
ncbi:MAG: copper resistance protein CopC, partial [Microcella pacifica]